MYGHRAQPLWHQCAGTWHVAHTTRHSSSHIINTRAGPVPFVSATHLEPPIQRLARRHRRRLVQEGDTLKALPHPAATPFRVNVLTRRWIVAHEVTWGRMAAAAHLGTLSSDLPGGIDHDERSVLCVLPSTLSTTVYTLRRLVLICAILENAQFGTVLPSAPPHSRYSCYVKGKHSKKSPCRALNKPFNLQPGTNMRQLTYGPSGSCFGRLAT